MAPISRQVALVSYPRSGNSLLRSLLESCTGILTGSDGHADAPLSRDLAAFGLAAEGISDGRVWLVKSHWPERRGAAEVRVPRRRAHASAYHGARVSATLRHASAHHGAWVSATLLHASAHHGARSPPRFCMHLLTTARASATLLHASAHQGPRPPRPSSPRCECMRRCSSCVARWMRSTRIGIWF